MASILEKDNQLKTLATANRRGSRTPKILLITSIVLVAFSMIMGLFLLCIVPALGLFLVGLFLALRRKPSEHRVAIAQQRWLRKAVEDSLRDSGINAQRSKDIMKEYPWSCRNMEFEAALQQRFETLCRASGMKGGGILTDERLL